MILYFYNHLHQSIFNLSLFFILGGGANNVLGLQDVVVAAASGKVAHVFPGWRPPGISDRKDGCRKLKLAWKLPLG
jgi:hypothetical protein